ncbi:MAG: peptidogalycan biosysnthesis protein, partial [Candidatus Eremiobacterota bacterium]
IQRRLARVEAGVQGPHKLSRGYLPVLTYGSSFLTHPGLSQAVGKFLARERRQTLRDLELLRQRSPYRADSPATATLSR